jgi:hypothetical protein
MTPDEYKALFKKCIYCGTDTRLRNDDVPVCLSCAKELQAGRIPPFRKQATSLNIPNGISQ